MDNYKIYPKQYRNENIPVQKNKCFVLMQFSSDLDIVYGTIKDELQKNGFICNRADDVNGSPIIFNKILTEMLSSRFIIAELSHNNANVFYELGIAHSFKESQNIIIIKQSSDINDSYPFDLKHLQYIEYSQNNLKLLTAKIIQYIDNNKYLSDFYDILNIKGIIPFVSDNQDEFITYLLYELDDKINIITEILNANNLEYDQNKIENIFASYECLIQKTINQNRFECLDGILKLYYELIFCCSYYRVAEVYLSRFLDKVYDVPDSVSWKINLINKLVWGKRMLNICMPWAIEYFSKLSVTNIDLNRHKLERLLLTCNYDEVNECIIYALYSSNCHIRESMADIVGEKRLKKALDVLYNRLEIEENTYVTRSVVEAIGKTGGILDIERLLLWFEKSRDKFEKNKYYGIYNHMAYAIQKMDSSIEKKYLRAFVEKYKRYIHIPEWETNI